MATSVTFQGNPLTLVSDQPNVGDSAPDATVLANDLSPVSLSQYKGKVVVLTSVPSLDTPVCDTETRKFNEAAGALGDSVAVLAISVDLPFAQARWCGSAGIENVTTLSDYNQLDFGKAYGLAIEELRLLARAVFVVDADGTIRYKELVEELTNEPDYDAALGAVKELL